jgi:putative Mg2+ transporter-C (MgtC) family protein
VNKGIKGVFMWDLFLRITLSGIMAGVIGLERELHSKEAGLKTHFLVGVGSALIMVVSKYGFYDIVNINGIALDPSRIAAQVVSGISFLGAGTIIFEKHYIRGLTTAAGIWATAGIGLAIGAGMYEIGIFSTILVLVGLDILNRIFKNTINRYVDINIWTKFEGLIEVEKVLFNNDFLVTDFKSRRALYNNYESVIQIEAKLKINPKANLYTLIGNLYENKDVLKIEIPQNSI